MTDAACKCPEVTGPVTHFKECRQVVLVDPVTVRDLAAGPAGLLRRGLPVPFNRLQVIPEVQVAGVGPAKWTMTALYSDAKFARKGERALDK